MIAPALVFALLSSAEPLKIATLKLDFAGVPPDVAESATLLVPTEVRRARPDARVISSEDVRSLLTHQKNQLMLGCAGDQSCLADVGGILGVDEIVAGQVGILGTTWVLELHRLDVKQARNIASATRAVKSADSLVGAVRSAAGELYATAPPTLPAGAACGRPVVSVTRPADEDLPRPVVGDLEMDFRPIAYKGTANRRAYDLVRAVVVGARIPIDQERVEDDNALRLRTDWIVLERGRRFRFRLRVDGRVGLEMDRQKCDAYGCDETEDVSKGEYQLATDFYAALRAPVEKVRF